MRYIDPCLDVWFNVVLFAKNELFRVKNSLCGLRSKAPVVSLSKKLYTHCLVLVASRNGFERDSTIELE